MRIGGNELKAGEGISMQREEKKREARAAKKEARFVFLRDSGGAW